MGLASYIVLEREIPEFDAFVNGKSIVRAQDRLDELAVKLGVNQLTSFVSAAPEEVLSILGDIDPELVDELETDSTHWFDANDGLKTVRALRDYLSSSPESIADAEGVIDDLNEYDMVLDRASKERVRWRLAIDI